MTTFVLPDLGEGLQEAEIVDWHVAVGQQVAADQLLVSVETDKAVVEIPSPRAGRIARLMAAPGDVVRIGAPLVEFEQEPGRDAGTVVGKLAQSRNEAMAREALAPSRPPASGSGGLRAVPAVRHLARKLGVDLASIRPSGPDGLVTRGDVERAASGNAAPVEGQQSSEPGAAAARQQASEPGSALRGPRRAMARNMSRAHAQVVPATVTDEADIDGWSPKSDPLVRLVRAVVAGCRAEPALNAGYDGTARTLHERVDLGIAVDTPEGLFVPVLRDAGGLASEAVRSELDRLRSEVEKRTITPEALRGATLTLSNFGTLGGQHAALVVVPPQVAIVGAGRIAARAVAFEGAPVVHRTLPLSLSFDHRVVTGGEATRFLAAMLDDLEAVD